MIESVSRRRSVLLSALLPLIAAPAVLGQESEPAPPESDVIRIEVVATDRKGNPVADLQTGDFVAEIDGKPATILDAEPIGAPAGAPSAERRSLALAIYVDSTNLDVKRRSEVLERLSESLRHLQPMDRVMILAAQGDSVTVEQEFTSDTVLIDYALERIARSTVAQQRDTEFDQILRLIERTLGPAQNRYDPQSEVDSQNVAKSLRAYADQQHRRTVATCDRLGAAIDALGGVPGRKVLVYVGAGMSLNPGEELLNALRSSRAAYREEGPFDGTESSLPVDLAQDTGRIVTGFARYASVNNVTVHSFDVGNQRSPMTTGAAETGATDLGSTQPGENVSLPAINFGRRSDLEGSLQLITAETGGLLIRKHQDVTSTMERLLDDREGAYFLTFARPDTGPEEIHSVDIGTSLKRSRTRHRRTFRAPGEDDLVVEMLRTALLGGAAANPLDAWVESKEPGPLEGDSYTLNVRIRVPVERLALEPLQQSHRAQLTVYSASSDGDLWTSRIDKQVLPIMVPNEQILAAMGQSIDYSVEMRIFQGREQVALAVRDDLGPEVSILTLIAPAPEQGTPPGQ